MVSAAQAVSIHERAMQHATNLNAPTNTRHNYNMGTYNAVDSTPITWAAPLQHGHHCAHAHFTTTEPLGAGIGEKC